MTKLERRDQELMPVDKDTARSNGSPGGALEEQNYLESPGSPVYSRGGMVSSGHPLASSAGMTALEDGGNAMDAAVAMAAVTSVVMPDLCGIGGDSFIIYYDASEGSITAFNGSGVAPAGATVEYYRSLGHESMPLDGLLSVAVPGSVHAWETALKRSGRTTLRDQLQRAIGLASDGFPVDHRLSQALKRNTSKLAKFPSTAAVFLQGSGDEGVFGPGEILRQPELARSLEILAQRGAEAFYEGELAAALDDYSRSEGGLIRLSELASHGTQTCCPLVSDYRGYQVYETAPPSQGFLVLEELNILEGFDVARLEWGSCELLHLMIEAKKLAFADRLAYAGDSRFVDFPLETLLSKAYAARRSQDIHPDKAGFPHEGGLNEGDTTSFVAVDGEGNIASFIHSLSYAFGSGVVAGDSGILLNNRAGRGFVLDEGHPNCLAPLKKTMHTLNTYLVMKGGQPVAVGNTPGGDGQPQWNFQVLVGLLDYGFNAYEAVSRPRWTSIPGTDPAGLSTPPSVRLENRFGKKTVSGLEDRGHNVTVVGPWAGGGSVQVIRLLAGSRVREGASDPRGGGQTIGQ